MSISRIPTSRRWRARWAFSRNRVEDPGELPGAVKEMLAHDGPALLDVVTAKQELSMPPTITPEQVKGFSLWVLRAVMNGRGDEVLDLAKTNLLPR